VLRRFACSLFFGVFGCSQFFGVFGCSQFFGVFGCISHSAIQPFGFSY